MDKLKSGLMKLVSNYPEYISLYRNLSKKNLLWGKTVVSESVLEFNEEDTRPYETVSY